MDAATADGADAAPPPPPEAAGRRRRRPARKQALKLVSSEKLDWLIYTLFTQNRLESCLEVIESQLAVTGGTSEYALFIKGLVQRRQGHMQASLVTFQRLMQLYPNNVETAKQVARSLSLMGRFKSALEVYEQARKLGLEDWRMYLDCSICHSKLGNTTAAEAALNEAMALNCTVACLRHLATLRIKARDLQGAIDALEDALKASPEDARLMVELGLLHLKHGRAARAFTLFGSALTYDPSDAKAILAAGSFIQENDDYDVALVKYRVSAVRTPESAELWNNIGMCFFGKKKYIAAVACLKRAAYLAPFEWMIAFNLGLVHLTLDQPASAFHYFSASAHLRPEFASAYGLLGVTLHRLQDVDNAERAFARAVELNSKDPLTLLNYCIFDVDNGRHDRAKQRYKLIRQLLDRGADDDDENPEVTSMVSVLEEALGLERRAQRAPPPKRQAAAGAAAGGVDGTPLGQDRGTDSVPGAGVGEAAAVGGAGEPQRQPAPVPLNGGGKETAAAPERDARQAGHRTSKAPSERRRLPPVDGDRSRRRRPADV